MQGWGYGSWGGGPWGIGNLIVGNDTLTITTLQASWKSDMIITTGAPTATSTTGFAVTLEIGQAGTAGQGSLSFTGFDQQKSFRSHCFLAFCTITFKI